MKRLRLILAVVGGVVLSSSTAGAITYWDDDLADNPVLLNKKNPIHNGTFNIVTGDGDAVELLFPGYGYDPLSETVVSAEAWFFFEDDDPAFPLDPPFEKVRVDLGSVTGFIGPAEVGFDTCGGAFSGAALIDLNTDGILTYTIKRLKGDFLVVNAILIAEAAPRQVPDAGGSLALLGLALLGLAGTRRTM